MFTLKFDTPSIVAFIATCLMFIVNAVCVRVWRYLAWLYSGFEVDVPVIAECDATSFLGSSSYHKSKRTNMADGPR